MPSPPSENPGLFALTHSGHQPSWTSWLPLAELGGILIGAGVLSVWLDHFLRREQQALDDARLRELLHEQAPAMRDAVLDAFAANHDDLARIATPQLLDQLITNSLALRLRDPQFAAEIYTDIRDQAIGAAERWLDAHLSVELATHGRNDYEVTVRWEYTVTPVHRQRRFLCTSDRSEYLEVAHNAGATSAWYLKPRPGLDAATRDSFELLRFTVDGTERPIRRTARKGSQIYTVDVGAKAIEAKEPVVVAYTYRTTTRRNGHLLFFDIEQPTRDLRIDLDYTTTDIATISTLDLIPSVRRTRIEQSPPQASGRVVHVDIDGWIFPRSGVAFVWTEDD